MLIATSNCIFNLWHRLVTRYHQRRESPADPRDCSRFTPSRLWHQFFAIFVHFYSHVFAIGCKKQQAHCSFPLYWWR